MSSKGVRAAGTDGSDFEHRETVASRYKTSLKFKSYLRVVTWLSLLLWSLMGLKLLNHLAEQYEILIPDIAEWAIPEPLGWEYVYLLSFIPSVFGLLSLSHNRLPYLNILFYGIPLVSVTPVVAAAGYMAQDFISFGTTHKSKDIFLGYPLVWLWFVFFALALQLHLLQLFFALQLRRAWHKTVSTRSQ
ncbi:hypothetical protein BV898_02713 [Hypsibius exemplaris]|uniref:Protein jagunal n=1 Tax=Hypsibius exemplaris TaxID=2072580 RepID=A0A1W0X783_HYPEX|nr:hypothetical protein BV898_02713 [Hypsibius exemplaris]